MVRAAEPGDNLYNGASDNGTGVAGVLEIAEQFTVQSPKPERSVVFLLVTLEENAVAGGAGAGVAEALAELGIPMPVLHLGLPDTFIEHGDAAKMLAACGLDAAGIERAVHDRITLLPE